MMQYSQGTWGKDMYEVHLKLYKPRVSAAVRKEEHISHLGHRPIHATKALTTSNGMTKATETEVHAEKKTKLGPMNIQVDNATRTCSSEGEEEDQNSIFGTTQALASDLHESPLSQVNRLLQAVHLIIPLEQHMTQTLLQHPE